MCEYITGAMAMAIMVIALFITATSADAHEWYDSWCCSKYDCAEAKVQWLPDGRIKATTKYGTAIFGLDKSIRPSKDDKWHACIPPWATTNESKARCLYAPVMY